MALGISGSPAELGLLLIHWVARCNTQSTVRAPGEFGAAAGPRHCVPRGSPCRASPTCQHPHSPALAQLCPLLVLQLGHGRDLCPPPLSTHTLLVSSSLFALQVRQLPLQPARPAVPCPTMPYSETNSNTWENVSVSRAHQCCQPGRAAGELAVGWAGGHGSGTWHSPKLILLWELTACFPHHKLHQGAWAASAGLQALGTLGGNGKGRSGKSQQKDKT